MGAKADEERPHLVRHLLLHTEAGGGGVGAGVQGGGMRVVIKADVESPHVIKHLLLQEDALAAL